MAAQLRHYLDDFLLVGPPGQNTCEEVMSRMLPCICDFRAACCVHTNGFLICMQIAREEGGVVKSIHA